MAKPVAVRGKWRITVRRKGYPALSASFEKYKEAVAWGSATNAKIDAGTLAPPSSVLWSDLSAKYRQEMELRKPLGRSKLDTLRRLEHLLAGVRASSLTVERLARFGRERGVAGPTLATDLSYIRVVLRHAASVWGMPLANNVEAAHHTLVAGGFIHPSQERDRRPSQDELARIKAWYAQHSRVPMSDIIDFAIVTAMRAEEIASLRWADLNEADRTVLVRDRKDPRKKQGNDQTVPVLDAAWSIIQRRPRTDERIFPFNHRSWASSFPKACQGAEPPVVDLRFHDLRHEGITRLFEMGYQIPEVSLFSGHKTWARLKRYTQMRAAKLRRLSSEPPAPASPPAGASPLPAP